MKLIKYLKPKRKIRAEDFLSPKNYDDDFSGVFKLLTDDINRLEDLNDLISRHTKNLTKSLDSHDVKSKKFELDSKDFEILRENSKTCVKIMNEYQYVCKDFVSMANFLVQKLLIRKEKINKTNKNSEK